MTDKFRDLHGCIADVSRHYHFRETPQGLTAAQEWITNLLHWLSDLLARLFALAPMPSDTRAVSNLIKNIWYLVGFLCVLVLIYLLAFNFWRRFKRTSVPSLNAVTVSKLIMSEDWRNEARRLAEESNWRAACRALYMSCLRMFDEAAILPFAVSRTNYEYWYALAKEKGIQTNFRQLANVVDQTWFGKQVASQPDFEQCSKLLDDIEREVGKSPPRRSKP
jgi:hypothetical protein